MVSNDPPKESRTPPRAALEPVSPKASQLRAMAWAMTPRKITAALKLGRDKRIVDNLRDRRVIHRAEDLGVDIALATRDLLAARSIKDLVRASGGLYDPPKRFRNW